MTTVAVRRSFAATVFTDIADLLASQPPQALMSLASITIVSGEAGALVPLPANIALAVGAEWAYLRGIASSAKGHRGWTRALNWGALALVVLYGLLWGVRQFGTDPVTVFGPWVLTALHILPVAFVSLSAAMVHRSAVEAEALALESAEQAEQDRVQRLAEAEAEAQARLIEARTEIAIATEKAHARRAYQAAQAAQSGSAEVAHGAAPSVERTMSKEALCAAVREAYAANPQFSRTELARASGWSEAMVRKVIKQIQTEEG